MEKGEALGEIRSVEVLVLGGEVLDMGMLSGIVFTDVGGFLGEMGEVLGSKGDFLEGVLFKMGGVPGGEGVAFFGMGGVLEDSVGGRRGTLGCVPPPPCPAAPLPEAGL